MVAFVSLKRDAIHRAVRQMYTAVAERPAQPYHFPTGRGAGELLGYPDAILDDLPTTATESFAGVGYPFAAGVIRPGDRVLDIGSGSGTDALICAREVGPEGHVYALDLTAPMRDKLRATADAAGVDNLDVLEGDAEAIPLPDASVDAVTTNGVLNLVPDKARAFTEIFRVLKPGGRLQVADIALAEPVAERFRQDPQMWAECVVGAVEETRYLAMLHEAGFSDVEKLGEFDYFRHCNHAKTREVAELFHAHSITLRATRPLAVPAGIERTRRRTVLQFAREAGALAVALFAWFVCAGVPSLIALLGAVGAGGLAGHAYMFPVFALFLGLSSWLLWRTSRMRGEMRPAWLGTVGAVVATVTTWISLAGLYPPAGWAAYAGLAAVVAASVWSFVLARRPGSCLEEMVREAELRESAPPLGRRLAYGAVIGLLTAGTIYLMYASLLEVTAG